ncbi:MAG: Mrp/NBP35 family ATP-binding protein [Ilumatobacteraceae bacterium]|jgi:ATP-binding protein involved in chromosome partitioning|nr:Mrp/NBP35 family ATP-binding protein [Ilumatobacteraceae bacterium]MDP4702942.1 Mrp/NBP35 family ATP-binding protein [Ilumatobacteraceae bacterium]MDP5108913.1 Mrp/NBP35 family ATP-binding protein [Ilumatobacteraceae bacterium]
MPIAVEQVIEALRPVQDPELHRSIVDLGMVRDVEVSASGVVTLTVVLTIAGCPLRNEITNRVNGALRADPSVSDVNLTFGVMTDAERENVRRIVHGDAASSAGSQTAHGHAEGRSIPFAQPGSKTRPLLISSGKGGVGKSSVTTNLAVALAARGHTVGIVDADIYGFSIPRMLGADRDPVAIDQMLLPPEAWGVRCISIGYFVPDGQAVVWRGPMLHKALEQFLTDVYWDEPDFLLVDMPPGTGDIALSLSQYLPRAEVYVVTTPQPAAQKVARLSAAMAEKVNLTVRGVIENMSWFTGDDGKKYEIFGSGGGQELANELNVPLLGQIPLLNALREGGDDGHPITAVDPTSETAMIFHQMAERIATELKPKKIFSSALKIS